MTSIVKPWSRLGRENFPAERADRFRTIIKALHGVHLTADETALVVWATTWNTASLDALAGLLGRCYWRGYEEAANDIVPLITGEPLTATEDREAA